MQFEGANNTIVRARSGENVTLDCVVFLRQDTTVSNLCKSARGKMLMLMVVMMMMIIMWVMAVVLFMM